jgi:DegV family protein with EDD domain
MNTPSLAILTDSTCDIPADLAAKHHIHIIPQIIIWGDQTYQDRVELSPSDFYQRLKEDQEHPSTTQPSPVDFETKYQEIFDQGAEELLVLTVSGALSGTFQLASRVAEDFDRPIRVVDSRGPTMSLGWQVLAAARAREEGLGTDQILQKITRVRENLTQFVYLDTLKYLHRGGRIGTAARWIGGMLNFKPLVTINHQAGTVEAAGRARTRAKGLELLWDRFFGSFLDPQNLRVAVLHGNVPDQAQALADRIAREIQPRELLINMTGPVLGVNTGPGALALCGYPASPA